MIHSRSFFALLLSILPGILLCQDLRPPDTIAVAPVYWKHSLGTSFTVTQITLTDWAQGGENALAYAAGVIGNNTYDWHPVSWANSYRLAYGQTRLGGRETRKTDDKIDIESLLTYDVGAAVNPYAAVSLKTQFDVGFKYNEDGTRTAASRFFDPAYLVQSVGVGYQVSEALKTRLGIALREIVTSEFRTFSDDPATPLVLEKVKVEDGLESVTEGTWTFDESMSLNAKLELFSSFREPERIVVRGDNTFSARLGKVVTLVVNVQVINERKVTPRTQVKQSVAIGFAYALL